MMTTTKANHTATFSRQAAHAIAWLGRAALFGLGVLAVVALTVVAALLAGAMLLATVLPTTAGSRGG